MIKLSDAAVAKVRTLLDRESADGAPLALRVAVQPGGCSGLSYDLSFDAQVRESDIQTEFDGVRVIVDEMSVPYLTGTEVDYVDTLQESGFQIRNPNAHGTCACGDSFQ
jgi:iron-sulfur cluster assembly accessory protein